MKPLSEIVQQLKAHLRSDGPSSDVTEVIGLVDKLARDGRTSDLVQLWSELESSCDAKGPACAPWENVVDEIEEALALSNGEDRVEAVIELLGRDRVRTVQRPRSGELRARAFASRLSHGQSKEIFLSMLEKKSPLNDGPTRELFACWLHEVVLRGTSLERDAQAVRFHANLAESGHPLGTMPLRLLTPEFEAPTYMPMYGAEAIQSAVARLEGGPTSMRTIPPPAEQPAPKVTLRNEPSTVERMREALRPWTEGSNGKAEVKIFDVEPPLVRRSPGKWLVRALPLESLEGASSVEVSRVDSALVWGALFGAASNGGAYTPGLGGAYGRRAAWTSFSALVDATPGTKIEAAGERAEACAFLTYDAASDWFNGVAWDIGLLAVRPDGASIALLAATDTD
ncbi:hypothetical protein AKJ09_02072 [Labilithrix luteola]|uniref:Uncharacterized protein n=1 Tax=Labilithrix luteola TaxID=1391654 RepID=A0A0K1PPF5_9BACT|nr:DUF6183 family protein [Labilithrix luteola]AKU95408.1 hypothetical protein AKJ09_02072 [Labilithrix luteola]